MFTPLIVWGRMPYCKYILGVSGHRGINLRDMLVCEEVAGPGQVTLDWW